MKKLYGIGTGPGDPELLTVKATKIIKGASVIFAPNNKGLNMALDTCKEFIGGTRIVFIDFQMGNVTPDDYISAAGVIYDEIPTGEYGVYLTIGDSMIYSTFIYIMEQLEETEIQIELIPGIPSFVAAANVAQIPLTVKGDTFILCDEFHEDVLKVANTVAILKTFKNKEVILNKLQANNIDFTYIKRASLENQQIIKDKDEILKDKDYISLILGRK